MFGEPLLQFPVTELVGRARQPQQAGFQRPVQEDAQPERQQIVVPGQAHEHQVPPDRAAAQQPARTEALREYEADPDPEVHVHDENPTEGTTVGEGQQEAVGDVPRDEVARSRGRGGHPHERQREQAAPRRAHP